MSRIGISTLVFFFVLTSCQVKKNSTRRLVKKTDDSRILLPEIKAVTQAAFDFDYLSYKSKCDYKDLNNTNSFTMNLRMKRDSILWISITALGFEVARARLDLDSVKIISRLEKKYYCYAYDYIKKISGTSLTFMQIQNLLTANLLFAPENYSYTDESMKFKCTETYLENTIKIDDKSKLEEVILQHLVELSNATILYSNYKKSGKQYFPGTVDIAIKTPKQTISLLMDNSGISTETIESFPFEISDKYEKGN